MSWNLTRSKYIIVITYSNILNYFGKYSSVALSFIVEYHGYWEMVLIALPGIFEKSLNLAIQLQSIILMNTCEQKKRCQSRYNTSYVWNKSDNLHFIIGWKVNFVDFCVLLILYFGNKSVRCKITIKITLIC